MRQHARQMGLVALVALGLLGLSPAARAQFNFNNNTNPGLVSGLTQAQYMALLQQAAAARAVQAQAMFPAGGAVNPYTPVTANPYAPVTSNPYSPYTNQYNSPYDPYGYGYNPYSYMGSGNILMGQADVMRAYGTVITSQEQARIMREQALQARLDTRKKKFDLDMYIKANTPSWSEEQAKIAKLTLKRIQGASSEAEIVNGKALNLLLNDMAKHLGKKAPVDPPIMVSEDVLRHLNITKGSASLGVLRNGGEFKWPIVFQEYFPADQLKLVESQAKMLVKNADQGKLDVNVLRELRNELDKLGEQLFKKLDDIPTVQLLEAKRFLGDFNQARMALEKGEAATQVKFQKWTAGGAKNLQELVDYMIANGLQFTSSIQGDEFAYRAIYPGMAALDVALNAMVGTPPPPEALQQNDN